MILSKSYKEVINKILCRFGLIFLTEFNLLGETDENKNSSP